MADFNTPLLGTLTSVDGPALQQIFLSMIRELNRVSNVSANLAGQVNAMQEQLDSRVGKYRK